MDEDERKRRKIRQTIKVAIAELAMVLSVIAIVAVAMLLSMGFSVTSNGDIEQTGLVQIHSIPTGATVEVDGGKLFARTNLSRTLADGDHEVVITKDGYDSWSKIIRLRSGVLMRLYYPRLFPTDRTAEAVKALGDELEFYTTSDDRTSILYAEKSSTTWRFINIKSDEPKYSTLDLSEILPGVVDGKFVGRVVELKWTSTSDYVLARIAYDSQSDWVMVNMKDVKSSVNLTKTFGLDFTQIELIDGTAGQLYALENHQLRKINTADQAISRVLLNNVFSFAVNERNVVYVAEHKNVDGELEKVIGVYKDGEKGGTVVATAKNNAAVMVALSKFYGDDFISYSINNEFTALYGNLPSYKENGDEDVALNVLVENVKLSSTPDQIDVSAEENQFVVMRSGTQFMVVDLDDGRLYEYESPSRELHWIDEAMMYAVDSNALKVWDYDGLNQRTIVDMSKDEKKALGNYEVVITHNNKWLYYLLQTQDGLVLTRELVS